jgi:hypothetical protein
LLSELLGVDCNSSDEVSCLRFDVGYILCSQHEYRFLHVWGS